MHRREHLHRREHWAQIASTTPLERGNREIKRRSDVIVLFPNNEAIVGLVDALMLETNDEWTVAGRGLLIMLGPLRRSTLLHQWVGRDPRSRVALNESDRAWSR